MTEFRTVELGDAIIEVVFLRGKADGVDGWWTLRRGKGFDYEESSFHEGRDHPRWLFQVTALPTPEHAAAAVHLSFCDASGEGLSCPKATAENVALKERMGGDGVAYVVIAKRTRTERVPTHGAVAKLQ